MTAQPTNRTGHTPHPPGMDAAHGALERARATEHALAALRAELASLESTHPLPLDGGAADPSADPSRALGTSIDDLVALHEGHATHMRELGAALRDDPKEVEENDLQTTVHFPVK